MPIALALTGCGGTEEAAPRDGAARRAAPAPAPVPALAQAPPAAPSPSTGGSAASSAAGLVRDHHRLIGARDYRAAWLLREPSPRGPGEQAFARAYSQYAEYRATVGAPSEIVSAGGWDYVEVPVQIYGSTLSARPFASAGTVTVRRRTGKGEWRIAPAR